MSVIYLREQDGELLEIYGHHNRNDGVEVGEVVDEVERLVQLYAGHSWQ